MNNGNKTYVIPVSLLNVALAKINKINAKARKIGVPGYEFVLHGERPYTIEGKNIQIQVNDLELIGNVVVISGWCVVGMISLDEAVGAVLQELKDVTLPRTFMEHPFICEHCNTDRRRNTTYILANENGEFKQVGASCLADFLGRSPDAALFALELTLFLDDLEKECDSEEFQSSHSVPVNPLLPLITATLACINVAGYISGKTAEIQDKTSTKELVKNYLFNTAFAKTDLFKKINEVERKIIADGGGQIIMEEIRKELESTVDLTNFQHIVKQVWDVERCTYKLTGYVIGAIGVHLAKKAALNDAVNSNFVGNIGEKIVDLPVELVKVNAISTDYGTSTIYTFRDLSGNVLVWFSSGKKPDVVIGDKCKLSGAVKDHKEFRGVKQTGITRAKVSK